MLHDMILELTNDTEDAKNQGVVSLLLSLSFSFIIDDHASITLLVISVSIFRDNKSSHIVFLSLHVNKISALHINSIRYSHKPSQNCT